jgi:uncharacterized protein (DUF58 family)
LISFQPSGAGTNVRQALEYFNHVHKKRTIAFLISDFLDQGYDHILRIIGRKHDVIAVELADPREEILPDVGMMKFRDAESGTQRWIDTANPAVRAAFVQYWQKQRAERKNLFIRSHVDAIPIRVDRPYIKPIVDFFQRRERRR